jgi:hypothetical protein
VGRGAADTACLASTRARLSACCSVSVTRSSSQQIRAHTNKEGCRSYLRKRTPTHARMHACARAHTPVLGGMRGALICLGALGSGPPARSACRWRRAAGRTSVSGTATATGRACGSTQRQ